MKEEEMPLLKGKKNFGHNVSEMMHKYMKTGKIGNTKPKNRKKARQIALAAAYSTMRG